MTKEKRQNIGQALHGKLKIVKRFVCIYICIFQY